MKIVTIIWAASPDDFIEDDDLDSNSDSNSDFGQRLTSTLSLQSFVKLITSWRIVSQWKALTSATSEAGKQDLIPLMQTVVAWNENFWHWRSQNFRL